MDKVIDEIPIVLEMKGLSLDIPLYSSHSNTLKNALINNIRGGKIQRKNKLEYVRALNNINCIVKIIIMRNF